MITDPKIKKKSAILRYGSDPLENVRGLIKEKVNAGT